MLAPAAPAKVKASTVRAETVQSDRRRVPSKSTATTRIMTEGTLGVGAVRQNASVTTQSPQGIVVFFTGLSSAGKSSLARHIADRILESGDRTVSVLDGDVVRRHLSAKLGYSAEDRDTNVRTIGWVAAEIARHGGLALCCAIAPYESSRVAAREYARAAGVRFALIHVATPLSECERRDRKGLYAKARAGRLRGVTGIDDPYEIPEGADMTIDTTGLSVAEAANRVMTSLGCSPESGDSHPLKAVNYVF